jgi:hypothetical protein
MRRIGKRLLSAMGLAALMFCMSGAVALQQSPGYPHHCDSQELQGKSCSAPGNCWNACAFHCGNDDSQCYMCCQAFTGIYKDKCEDACDDVPD